MSPYDQRVMDLLLADNAALLEIVCHSPFVGDTAATVSKGVLTLLKYRSPHTTEDFLKRIFRTRAVEYICKSRDLSDIIRDNSMATMLLNAFAKACGYGFLSISLTAPLNGIFGLLEECEIDPAKLKGKVTSPAGTVDSGIGSASTASPHMPAGDITAAGQHGSAHSASLAGSTPAGAGGSASADPGSSHTGATSAAVSPNSTASPAEQQLEEHRRNLETACTRLFAHIFENKRRMPSSLRRMCFFLLTTVNEMADFSPNDIAERARLATAKRAASPASNQALALMPHSSTQQSLATSKSSMFGRSSMYGAALGASGGSSILGASSSAMGVSVAGLGSSSSTGATVSSPVALSSAAATPSASAHAANGSQDNLQLMGSSSIGAAGGSRKLLRMLSFKKKNKVAGSNSHLAGTKDARDGSQSPGASLPSPHPLGSSANSSSIAGSNARLHDECSGSPHAPSFMGSTDEEALGLASLPGPALSERASSKKPLLRRLSAADSVGSRHHAGEPGAEGAPASPLSLRIRRNQTSVASSVRQMQPLSGSSGSQEPSAPSIVIDPSRSAEKLAHSSSFMVDVLAAGANVSMLPALSIGPSSGGAGGGSISASSTSNQLAHYAGSAYGPSGGVSPNAVPSPTALTFSISGIGFANIRMRASNSNLSTLGTSPRSAGWLTVAEKVVGSFLFLRFFVPAITSPETNALLLSDKLTPQRRRGLVLCGKLLTALCNDIEFGNKEDYLMPFNDYLKNYRDSMKEYINYAASPDSLKPSNSSASEFPGTSIGGGGSGGSAGSGDGGGGGGGEEDRDGVLSIDDDVGGTPVGRQSTITKESAAAMSRGPTRVDKVPERAIRSENALDASTLRGDSSIGVGDVHGGGHDTFERAVSKKLPDSHPHTPLAEQTDPADGQASSAGTSAVSAMPATPATPATPNTPQGQALAQMIAGIYAMDGASTIRPRKAAAASFSQSLTLTRSNPISRAVELSPVEHVQTEMLLEHAQEGIETQTETTSGQSNSATPQQSSPVLQRNRNAQHNAAAGSETGSGPISGHGMHRKQASSASLVSSNSQLNQHQKQMSQSSHKASTPKKHHQHQQQQQQPNLQLAAAPKKKALYKGGLSRSMPSLADVWSAPASSAPHAPQAHDAPIKGRHKPQASDPSSHRTGSSLYPPGGSTASGRRKKSEDLYPPRSPLSQLAGSTSLAEDATHSKSLSASAEMSKSVSSSMASVGVSSGGGALRGGKGAGSIGTIAPSTNTESVSKLALPPNVIEADLTSLFTCLVKNIDKVEREVDERVRDLPDRRIAHLVTANFHDLRTLLESGPYADPERAGGAAAAAAAHKKKSGSWWSRIFKTSAKAFGSRSSSNVESNE
nr:Ras GTPase activating protein ira2 [Polyrhizophydium stewartii]